MKVVLTTLNAKYIHKNLALRWLYVSRIPEADVELMEFVIKDDLEQISDQIALRCISGMPVRPARGSPS